MSHTFTLPPAFNDAIKRVLNAAQPNGKIQPNALHAMNRLAAFVRDQINDHLLTTLRREPSRTLTARDVHTALLLSLPITLRDDARNAMVKDKNAATEKKSGAPLVAHMYLYLRAYHRTVDVSASAALVKALEYVIRKVIVSAGNTARDDRKHLITLRHLQLVIRRDEDLQPLFHGMQLVDAGVIERALLSSGTRSRRRGGGGGGRAGATDDVDLPRRAFDIPQSVLERIRRLKGVRYTEELFDGDVLGAEECVLGIYKQSLKSIAYRAGVKRVSSLLYGELRGVLRVYLDKLLKDALLVMEHAERDRLECDDIDRALIHALQRFVNVFEDSVQRTQTRRRNDRGGRRSLPGKRSLVNSRQHEHEDEDDALLEPKSIVFMLVRAIVQESRARGQHTDIAPAVFVYLSAVAEAYLIDVLQAANRIAISARRETVMPKDIIMVRLARGEIL